MREYEGHVGPREGTVLVFTLLSAMLFLQFPQFLIQAGGPAGWQVVVVMTAGGLLVLVPVCALAGRFPGLGLAEISLRAAGPIAGPLLTLAVSLWLFATAAVTLRSFAETFLTSILPETPPSVLIIVGVSCALIASYRGLETIARTTQVLLPLVVLGVLLVLLLLLPRMDTSLLYPFWGYGIQYTLAGGLYCTSLVAETIVLLAMGYAFRDGASFRQSAMRGVLLFGVAAAATVTVLVGILGAPTAAQTPFPLFNLARLVYLGRFLQRIEALVVMFWFFAAAIRLSILLHAAVVSLAGALRLPSYRPLLFSVAPILVALSLLPEDFIAVLRLERYILRPVGFVVLAVPLLLWLAAALRGLGAPPRQPQGAAKGVGGC